MPVKRINHIHTDWNGNKIHGQLILVDKLSMGDLFICTQLFNMFVGKFPILLSDTNEDDVEISANNKTQYYIFKPNS